jgi:hypothetical protein
MRKIRAEGLRVGDVIMPPAREVQLWMRRHLQERNLPETALYLTITEIHEGEPDKRGRWLWVTNNQTDEWNGDRVKPQPFKFKVRPETPWPVL